MKKTLIIIAGLASSLLVLPGCASIERALAIPAPQPVTNALGQVYTPLVIKPAILPYYDSVAAITPLLPSPIREAAGGLLAALAGAAAIYLHSRNQIKAAQAATEKSSSALMTVIKSVETTTDTALKSNILSKAVEEGTQAVLHDAVKKVT